MRGYGVTGNGVNKVLITAFEHWGLAGNVAVTKSHNSTNGLQSHFLGSWSPANEGFTCANGALQSNCGSPSIWDPIMVYDPAGSRWLYNRGADVFAISEGNTGSETVSLIATLNSTPKSLAYRISGTDQIFYYCSAGRLNKYIIHSNLTTQTSALEWPTSEVSCNIGSLIWAEDRNSLIFAYTSNNLSGLAEYINP